MQSKTRCRIVFHFCLITLVTYCQPAESQEESCTVPTRLPSSNVGSKDAGSCTGSCEVWTSFGACQVDPTCFFKTTLALVEPAAFSHVLDLANIHNPSDVERKMKLVPSITKKAVSEIDDVFERIVEIHFSFEKSIGLAQPKRTGRQVQQPREDQNLSPEGNLTCAEKCEFPDNQKCRLGFFCYLNQEIIELQQKNHPLSHLLNLSFLDSEEHKFDDEGVLEELITRLAMEKLQMRTFLFYAFSTYNITIDINNRNIDYVTKYLKNSELSEGEDADAECSTAHRQLIHRPAKLECKDDFLKFLSSGYFGRVSARAHRHQGFPSDGENCLGLCVESNMSRDCFKDINCMKKLFNYI